MKKIDLHIHTVKSISDYDFEFCLEALKEYTIKLEIDGIAITNHNLFDLDQFSQISRELKCKVFPGIEINLEKGHLLLIAECTELLDFQSKCNQIKVLINDKEDWITVEKLNEIFPDLSKYILIPHYEKNPNISDETISKLHPNITAGEVTSTRKFKSCLRDPTKLIPVLFSDIRITKGMNTFPIRQTFIDLSDITLRGIKSCLSDKNKVCLSKNEGNKHFQVTDDGLFLSTGLNIMLGERSSGKTYTLNRIQSAFENVKYIKQFALLQNDEEKFESLLSTRHSTVNEAFLKEFRGVVGEIKNIDLRSTKLEVEKYLSSLLKYASESDKLDSFSKATLFSESLFVESDLKGIERLIEATITLIENTEFEDIITKHLRKENLKALVIELINKYGEVHEANLKRRWLNDLITKVKEDLKFKTTNVPPSEIDFYNIVLEVEKIKKFNLIVKEIQKEREIDRKEIRGFKVIAKTKKFTGAMQMIKKAKRQLVFSTAFSKYDSPYAFLNSLKEIHLEETEYYKYFVDIEYQTLNKHNFLVSGGERSEFNLLHEIGDALQYDLLLVDEPESSFDNLFLKNEVNELLKEISKEIPVVIVTHNSTVGASIKPDYLLYTQKSIINSTVKYEVFFGYPSDKQLKSIDGSVIDNYQILLCCLEAGSEAYDNRRTTAYEILKD
ncbi:MAG: PHP domain-containing protein [Bacteroidota bacterium]